MKKIPLKRIFAAAALVCCLTVTTAYADVTQEDIDNAKNQINNLKNQQKDAQDAVDDINGKKGQLESDLNNLNGQMTNIVSSMNALESQINDKKKELSDLEDEIDQTQDNLEAAKQQSASQYEDMKIRIRYMYENGNVSFADSIMNFLKDASQLLKPGGVCKPDRFLRPENVKRVSGCKGKGKPEGTGSGGRACQPVRASGYYRGQTGVGAGTDEFKAERAFFL